uniref:Uncharacterized protein n=1 Tax=Salix viminalis TaxID=40686 RepID=A0A6N2N7I8_SALVM
MNDELEMEKHMQSNGNQATTCQTDGQYSAGKLPESRGQDDAEILVENEKNSDVKPAVNGVVRLKHED